MDDTAPVSAPAPAESSPAQSSESPTEAKSKYKVKVDGKELEVDQDELVRGYQLSSASRKRMEEAAEIRKNFQGFSDSLKRGELDWLMEQVPRDQLRKFSEKLLLEEIEFDQLPESDKKLRQLEKEHAKLKKANQDRDAQDKDKEFAQMKEQVSHRIDAEMTEAIKESGQAVTPEVIALMATWARTSLQDGEDPLPAKQALQLATKSATNVAFGYLKSLPPDKLLAAIPKEIREAIRKADVEAVKSQNPIGRGYSGKESSGSKIKQPMYWDDAMKVLEKRLK